MQNFEEKEIKITQHDCVQSRDEPSAFSTNGTQMLSLTSECLTTTPPGAGATSTQFRVDASKCCIKVKLMRKKQYN